MGRRISCRGLFSGHHACSVAPGRAPHYLLKYLQRDIVKSRCRISAVELVTVGRTVQYWFPSKTTPHSAVAESVLVEYHRCYGGGSSLLLLPVVVTVVSWRSSKRLCTSFVNIFQLFQARARLSIGSHIHTQTERSPEKQRMPFAYQKMKTMVSGPPEPMSIDYEDSSSCSRSSSSSSSSTVAVITPSSSFDSSSQRRQPRSSTRDSRTRHDRLNELHRRKLIPSNTRKPAVVTPTRSTTNVATKRRVSPPTIPIPTTPSPPQPHTIVYLIRHGQSQGQVTPKMRRLKDPALLDCGLTKLGQQQAITKT